MRMNNLKEIETFRNIIADCEGDVWMENAAGSKYDLKSEISQFVVMAELLTNPKNDLELYASRKEDEIRLIGFLKELNMRRTA